MTAPFIPAPARRPGWLAPLLVAVVALVLAAGGVTAWALTRTSAPQPVVAAATSRAATTTAATQSPEDAACTAAEDIAEADDYATRLAAARSISEPGTRSTDQTVRIGSLLVRDSAELAEAAAGMSDEDDIQRSLWRAIVHVREVCARR